MKLKVYLIFLVSCFYTNFCVADVGCLSDFSDFIYINRTTGTGPNGGPQYSHVSESSRIIRSSVYCVKYTTTSPSPCYINSTRTNYQSATGTLVNFFYVNCPLDDHLGYLFPFILISGFFLTRNKFLIG